MHVIVAVVNHALSDLLEIEWIDYPDEVVIGACGPSLDADGELERRVDSSAIV